MRKRTGIVILSVFILALILSAYLVFTHRAAILSGGLERATDGLVERVLERLPEDYDRQGARPVVKAFLAASLEGRLRGDTAEKAGEMLHAMMMGKKLTTPEADSLMAAMRASVPQAGDEVLDRQPASEKP